MLFYTEPGGEAIARAFKKFGEVMKSAGHIEAAIVVPQLSNLDGIISDYLGDDAIRCLQKHKVIRLNPESIHLFTKRHPPKFFKGPILAAFTTMEQVKSIIKTCPEAAIIYVPWAMDEMHAFKKLPGATLLEP